MAASGTVPTSHFTSSMDRAAMPFTDGWPIGQGTGKGHGRAYRRDRVGQCAHKLVNYPIVEASDQGHPQVLETAAARTPGICNSSERATS